MTTDEPRPLTEHLAELRKRLVRTLGAWLVAFLAAYLFKEDVFEILMWPAIEPVLGAGRKLSAIAPAELFMSYVKASFLAGFLVTVPITLYQAWKFIAPGLYESEKRMVVPFVVSASALFLAGNLFGYFVAFPVVFDYFLSLESGYVETQWTTETVFAFMSRLYLAFGVAFELPIVVFFLSAAGIVSVDQLSRWRPYAVVTMFVIGAILTPPDVVSQIMLSIPLILLYEVGLLAARLSMKRSAQPETAPADA